MNKKTLAGLAGIGCVAALSGSASAQIFMDSFDTAASAALWNVQMSSADNAIDFGWDYSALGIPSAPGGLGTTGVRMASNMTAGAATGLSMTPIGVVLPENYVVRFDMWINANGPFPDGGPGSTEFAAFGVGTSGNQVQRIGGSGMDGLWFAVDGEGGSGIDFRAYAGTTLQGATSGVYAAGDHADGSEGLENNVRRWSNPYYHTAFPGGQEAPALQQTNYPQQSGAFKVGTVGMGWREVEIHVIGGTVEWYIDSLLIATLTGFDGTGNVFIGYNDPFASLSDNADLSFAVFDNFQVIPEPSTYAAIFGGLALLGAFIRRRRRS